MTQALLFLLLTSFAYSTWSTNISQVNAIADAEYDYDKQKDELVITAKTRSSLVVENLKLVESKFDDVKKQTYFYLAATTHFDSEQHHTDTQWRFSLESFTDRPHTFVIAVHKNGATRTVHIPAYEAVQITQVSAHENASAVALTVNVGGPVYPDRFFIELSQCFVGKRCTAIIRDKYSHRFSHKPVKKQRVIVTTEDLQHPVTLVFNSQKQAATSIHIP